MAEPLAVSAETPLAQGVPGSTFERVNRRYDIARAKHELWRPLFADCYDYAFPHRTSIYEATAAESRTDKIYDATAVVAVQEFASRLQAGIVPEYARWAKLEAGTDIPARLRPKLDKQLEEVTAAIFDHVQSSNFAQEAHESLLDLAVGTGVILAEPGHGTNALHFRAVPLSACILDTGPFGGLDWFFRPSMVKYGEIDTIWPKATLNGDMAMKAGREPLAQVEIVECVYRDWAFPMAEVYRTVIFCPNHKHVLYETSAVGHGASPVIPFRWSKASGEVYGRGPLLNVLPDVKTLNLTVQLILENAELAVSGVWQTDNDSVFNEETVRIEPGTLYYRDPNTTGLQAIESPSRFDVAQIILEDMRGNVKKGLYDDMLGPVDGPVKSATEIAVRQAELSRRIGAPFGRLQAELVQPLLARVAYLLRRQGLIELPKVNGREVRVRSVSPLAQAQFQDDVFAMDQFAEMIQLRFGEQMVPVVLDPAVYADELAQKKGVPKRILRDPDQVNQILANLAQAQAPAA